MALLSVHELKQHYALKKGFWGSQSVVKAVDGVSFSLQEGETLGIVGESGCGKSSLGRTVLRLLEPTSGTIGFQGRDITNVKGAALKELRQQMQIVFQDPYASLNPRQTIQSILEAPMLIHGTASKQERQQRIERITERIGLRKEQLSLYPHEFSGGQRQRIGIARALMLQPRVIVADEPVSALDVSVQSQVLNLLLELQQEFSLSYLFISHDLSVIQHIADRVAVMYLGRIVELASVADLYAAPKHPYTKALLSAVPVADPGAKKERIILQGDLPSPVNPPPGCPFHTRCPVATSACQTTVPPLEAHGKDHFAACLYA